MAELYYDLGSPYAYLAVERAASLLGAPPRLRPLLLGAIFRLRGTGSWSQTPARAGGMAEVERRDAAYGLPPLRWPPGWPRDMLRPMRAAVWADDERFVRLAFRRAFAGGEDLADPAVSPASPATPAWIRRSLQPRSRATPSSSGCARSPRRRGRAACAACRP